MPAEAHHACFGRQIAVGTAALFVEAQDQIVQLRRPQQGQLALQIRGRPEAHDLDEKLSVGLESVAQQEIGKDDGAPGAHWFGLAQEIPVRRGPRKVAGKARLQLAVKELGHGGREEWIAALQVQLALLAAEHAGGSELEARAPGKEGKQLAQGPAVEKSATKDRIRTGQIQHWRIPILDCADKSAQLGLAHHRAQRALGADAHAAGAEEQATRNELIDSQGDFVRGHGTFPTGEDALAGQIGEKRPFQCGRRQT